jgi:hypothetical protein
MTVPNMTPKKAPRRRLHKVHRNRESSPGAIYYVSLTPLDNQPWLAVPRTRDVFLSVLRSWHAQRNGRVLAATALPNVAHVLLQLGSLLSAREVVAGWRAAMRHGAGYPQTFRDDLLEYRLKELEPLEDYGLSMFLAPYRAKILPVTQVWDGWWMPDATVFQFPAALNAAGGPPQEWVNWPASRFAGLARRRRARKKPAISPQSTPDP